MNDFLPLLRKLPPRVLDRILMQRTVQQAMGTFGYEIQPERWIFIIGCYNSATTLLASILRMHPSIGGLRTEGAYLTDSLPYPEQFGWPRMWCQCLDDIRLDITPENEALAQRIKRQWSVWFPKDTPNLVEKTVSNTARMPFLQAYFKPAYFIYIVRNGYAVASGIQRKSNLRRWKNNQYSRYPIELCAKQWRVSDELVEKDKGKIDNLLQIYYEDFADNPVATMRSITDFLGLPPMPQESLDKGWTVHGVKSTITNKNPESLQFLTKEDIRKIEDQCEERLIKHNYLMRNL